jgi:glyoxylase-like metal-dependent hydrolase (beta-lactamase superfamily II)
VHVDRVLRDGEVFELGARRFRTLVLPGHTRGHTCLFDETSRAVVAGDLVAGIGTVIIDPPEGDMADYLDSLKRLIDLGPGTLYPAHGPVIPGGVAKLQQYLSHRLDREAKVLGALSKRGAPAQAADLVPAAYPDVPPGLYGLAERSLLAHLLKLEKEGRARRDATGGWLGQPTS